MTAPYETKGYSPPTGPKDPMPTSLDKLCEAKNLRTVVKYGAPENPSFPNSDGWTVTLIYKRRRMTVPFYTGYAFGREPTAGDVLSCLISDTVSVDNARSFEDWAADLGFDENSRKAEATYRECTKNAVKLRRLLGNDFDQFALADH